MKKYLLLLLSLPFLTTGSPLREQIGQLIIVGFEGAEISPQNPVNKAITEQNIGGVILFDVDVRRAIVREDGSKVPPPRNITSPEQLRALTQTLQAKARTPLFIAADQEGGRVARLNKRNGFPQPPSHKTLAQESPETARGVIHASAAMLKAYGINFNLGPVLDIETPGNFIGAKERCFSKNPETVAEYAGIYIREHKEEGILCAAKHFPGHGATQGDSHLGLVDGTQTWSPKELKPYKELISQGILEAVLTGHLYLKQLDAADPASLSPEILTTLLREELGYNGLIITDDLNMGAIEKEYSLPEASVLALLAGNDIILICHSLLENPKDLEEIISAIETAVRSGRLPQKQLDASYQRVLKAKQTVGLIPSTPKDRSAKHS